MEQSIKEKCDLVALKTYAIQLGIDKGRVAICFNKEEVYNLISERLTKVLKDNKIYPTSTFKELCAFADSIGALTFHCETNNIPCVLNSIQARIIDLYESSLYYNFQFNMYINNIKELYRLIKIEENKNSEAISKMAKKHIENNQNHTSSNNRMKL